MYLFKFACTKPARDLLRNRRTIFEECCVAYTRHVLEQFFDELRYLYLGSAKFLKPDLGGV